MKLQSPFDWLLPATQRPVFVVATGLTILVMIALNVTGRPLNTAAAPAGIVSFELAGDLASAQRIVASWGQNGRVYAGINLGLDFLFLVCYPTAIGLGCAQVARGLARRSRWVEWVGVVLAWFQIGAGLLDAVENVALIRLLVGSVSEALPLLARCCAILKFAVVAAGLLYVLGGAVVLTAFRLSNRQRAS
jgi:hypothetical protein